jgi:hypothetical protein
MWMNRGALRRAKQRTPPSRRSPDPEALRRLAAAYGTSAGWSRVNNLDAATHAHAGDEPTPESVAQTLWTSAPWLVLRTLLYLLLRV